MTLASSPIDDVLEQGKGVCQDFTHLMIALLRSFERAGPVRQRLHPPAQQGIAEPCLVRGLAAGAGLGAASTPPTIGVVNEHFVKVAIGRDFTDVPPNKGVYRGKAQESIFVRVETRALERLPSLSWQEQLPPLNVPLTAIRPRPRSEPGRYQEAQQQ